MRSSIAASPDAVNSPIFAIHSEYVPSKSLSLLRSTVGHPNEIVCRIFSRRSGELSSAASISPSNVDLCDAARSCTRAIESIGCGRPLQATGNCAKPYRFIVFGTTFGGIAFLPNHMANTSVTTRGIPIRTMNGADDAAGFDVAIVADLTSDLAGPKPGRTSDEGAFDGTVTSSGLRTVRSKNLKSV